MESDEITTSFRAWLRTKFHKVYFVDWQSPLNSPGPRKWMTYTASQMKTAKELGGISLEDIAHDL